MGCTEEASCLQYGFIAIGLSFVNPSRLFDTGISTGWLHAKSKFLN